MRGRGADRIPRPPEPMQDGTVTVTFSADMSFVRPVRHLVRALCALARYGEDEIQTYELVATEMLNNSIEHGSNGPGESIEVTITVRADCFRMEVLDPGRGGEPFARDALTKATKSPNLEDARGRGLFLIRSFVDQLSVRHEPGRGTRVTVQKTRSTS